MATQPQGMTAEQYQIAKALEWTKLHLPPPTNVATVQNAGPDTIVILWRGISFRRLAKMITEGSLSGNVPANADALPPGESDAKSQVGTFQLNQVKLPEFTTKQTVAVGFGRGGAVVVIAVKRKYLTKGSGSEGGWVGSNDTPFEHLLWKPGEPGKRLNLNAD